MLLALTPVSRAADDDVQMTIKGVPAPLGELKPEDADNLVLSNGLLKMTFGKDAVGNYSATSLIKNGTELVHNLNGVAPRDVDRNRTWYVDYRAGGGHLLCDTVKIIKNTPEIAHFAMIDHATTSSHYLEHHVIMLKGTSGLYGYLILKAPRGGNINEMRTMYRFDMGIFDYAWNVERTGQQPSYKTLQDISPRGNVGDETWRFPDGTIYQKYDYCVYFGESPMWGHYGHGFGAFYIPVSVEYYDGGPLRQDLIVHQDALILNYVLGGHLGGHSPNLPAGFEKMFGPWLVYINSGPDAKSIISDALKKVSDEQAKWPYQWVDEPLYPTKRPKVTGQLKVADGRSAGGAMVVLGLPGQSDLYFMGGDYTFYRKADENGHFELPAVRPGKYTLYAYATQGSITDQLEKQDIEVKAADVQDLGTITWTPPKHNNILWQIGKADRMSGEFKLGDKPRSIVWNKQVPGDLSYTVGKSKDSEDWYFAQCQRGNWDVNFNVDKTYTGDAYLTVALAGTSGGAVSVSVNGTDLGQLRGTNDSAMGRAAIRGAHYQLRQLKFPASSLKQGQNTIRFALTSGGGGNGSGLYYDTIILEAD
jgi:rhamnogalacturonan endolyase